MLSNVYYSIYHSCYYRLVAVETRLNAYKSDLVKPSVYLPLHKSTFLEKFEVLWDEHIEGFKKRKKAKTESDMNMEWRKRLEEKQKAEKKPQEKARAPILPADETPI